jgi:hypothetical protein
MQDHTNKRAGGQLPTRFWPERNKENLFKRPPLTTNGPLLPSFSGPEDLLACFAIKRGGNANAIITAISYQDRLFTRTYCCLRLYG